MFNMVEGSSSKEQFAAIKSLLKHKALVVWVGTIGIALVMIWLGFRTGFADLYVLAAILAAVAYGVLKVAIEVVELVVQTLMPQ